MYVQCEVPFSRQVGNSSPSSPSRSSLGSISALGGESGSDILPNGDRTAAPSSSSSLMTRGRLLVVVAVAILFIPPPPHHRPFPRSVTLIRSTGFKQLVAHAFDYAGNGDSGRRRRRRAAMKMLLMMRDARPEKGRVRRGEQLLQERKSSFGYCCDRFGRSSRHRKKSIVDGENLERRRHPQSGAMQCAEISDSLSLCSTAVQTKQVLYKGTNLDREIRAYIAASKAMSATLRRKRKGSSE